VGLEAERAMFEATEGINTHKGAIFSLGIFLAICGRLMIWETPCTLQLFQQTLQTMTQDLALPVQRQRDNLVAPHHGFQSSHAEQIVVHPKLVFLAHS
jgi:triphosphoribosyl-dephospho-CoA synthetase